MSVRRAGPDDAAAIAAVHLASWQVACRDAAPPGWLAERSVERQTRIWNEILGESGARVLVATDDDDGPGEIIGFCGLIAPGRDDDADEDTAEVASFYVHPDRWRSGAERVLMIAAIAQLTAAGYETATLWVLTGNDRAIAFYEAFGFADDGARKHSDWPVQIRMRRTLA